MNRPDTEVVEDGYSGSDLQCRRQALGLTARALADLVGRSQGSIADSERGRRSVSEDLMNRVRAVETWAEEHFRRELAAAHDRLALDPDGPVPLQQLTAAQFGAAYPNAATRYAPIPVSMHDTALGRVAAWLAGEGHRVRILPAGKLDPPARRGGSQR